MEVPGSQKRWIQVQQLFAEVVGLDAERRSARLDRVEDPRLRKEVETLLDRHDRGEPIGPEVLFPVQDGVEHGEVVGHYRLIGELGRGAMGVVYKAEDTRLRRPVALKFLTPQLSADKRARARLEREAQAASALDHPNICTVYEIGETDDGRLYLVLACYDGETLERRIERGPLEVKEAVRVAVHMARGLAAAHRHGIVHRDVKPSNVLVTDDRSVKLLDFGIARIADSDLTGSGDTLGTVAYMSPEQLRGEVDARVDVWALGVVFYEMLAGRRPFGGDYEAALLYSILHEEPAPLDRDDVPADLAAIVERCLHKNSDARYETAKEVEVDLERLGLDPAAVRRTRRLSRRHRRLLLSAGAVVLLLILLLSPIHTAMLDGIGLGAGPDVRHLAVLPLMTPSAEASVAEGLTLTLTSLLTQIGAHAERPITVVPASEMREIKTAAQARERFNVGVVVSGDFQQAGGQAHLTLNLIDARTLRQLRTERLSELENRLPFLQKRVLIALSEMLDVPLSDEERASLNAGSTTSAEAYEFYLQGEAALDRFDQQENVDLAVQLLHWALEEDSLYALAHAALGRAYMWKYRDDREGEWVRLAETHSQRALDLAERLPPVRVTLGTLYNLTGDHNAAVEQFRVGIGLDPASAEAFLGLASSYRSLQRTNDAEGAYKQAIALQPDSWHPHNDLGNLYLESGRFDEAIRQFRKAIELAPNEVRPYEGMAACYVYQGDVEKVRLWARRALEIRPSYLAYSHLGDASYLAEEYEAAARSYERALEMSDSDYLVWGNLADVYSSLPGREEDAILAYERAIKQAEVWRETSPSDPEIIADMAMYYTALGKNRKALDLLSEVSMSLSADMFLAKRVAELYVTLGHQQKAREWLEEAIRRGFSIRDLEADPILRSVGEGIVFS